MRCTFPSWTESRVTGSEAESESAIGERQSGAGAESGTESESESEFDAARCWPIAGAVRCLPTANC